MALEMATPQRTLQGYGVAAKHKALLDVRSILPPLDPWGLSAEDRSLCKRFGRGLTSTVRIHAAGEVRIVDVRDSSLVRSDYYLRKGVEVAPLPNRRGVFQHRVKTEWGWRKVREKAKTGEFTTGGRARQGPFWLTWHPTPMILTIMRAKGLVELLQQPVPPPTVKAPTPRKVEGALAEPARGAEAPGLDSPEMRRKQMARLKFVGGVQP